jgi:thiol-disulfide isomerase/thioredoxin
MSLKQPHYLEIRADGFRTVSVARTPEAGEPKWLEIKLPRPMRGRVLDSNGNPVAGVRVGRRLSQYESGPPRLLSFEADGAALDIVTDAAGTFSVKTPVLYDGFGSISRPVEPLCFSDRGASSLGLSHHSIFDDKGQVAELRHARLVEIPCEVTTLASDPAADPEFVVTPEPRPHPKVIYAVGRLHRNAGESGAVRTLTLHVALPPGRYGLTISGRLDRLTTTIAVSEGKSTLILPTVKLESSLHAAMQGKLAQEIDALDLVTGQPVKLRDFRGKVVVLEFWGYWCGPCIAALNKLTRLRERFPGGEVVFLAVHDSSVRSRAEYERRISPIRRDEWLGRDLPLLVLLDRPEADRASGDDGAGKGRTIRAYGLRAFPSLFVIGPDGELVGNQCTADEVEPLVNQLLSAKRK